MKIKIIEDVFDIVSRIKEIDDGYFIVFDTDKGCYEIHNTKQKNTYCLTILKDLDSRALDLVLVTNIEHIDNIIDDIDKNNIKIEENVQKTRKSQADYMVREIYDFCNNSSKKFDDNVFQTEWR